jgi:ubiquinone/menaquinone biosynthesis C-methylase UbiE
MTIQSRFQSVDSTTDPLYFVRYVDRLSSNPEIIRCRKMAIEFIARDVPCTVVEVGCGVGDIAAQVARLSPDCRVLGLDKSKTMLEESRRRHAGIPNLEFREGSFAELPSLRADVVWIERVLIHCDEPESALKISADSLQLNGKLIVIEPDWGTLVVNGVQPRLAGLWTADLTNVQLSGTVGRQLPLLFRKNSIALERHEVAFLPFKTKAELDNLINLERTISNSVNRKAMSTAEGLELMKQFSDADEKEELLGFVALVIAMGHKVGPASSTDTDR